MGVFVHTFRATSLQQVAEMRVQASGGVGQCQGAWNWLCIRLFKGPDACTR